MSAIGVMAMPADFRYREVFLKGKPQHDRCDPFRIRHPRMNTGHRAKIFAPFDALKGFNEAVSAKEVLYEHRIELSPEDAAELDRRLTILHNLTYNSRMARANRVQVSVTYYQPCMDPNHDDYRLRGQYQTISGICWNVDAEVNRTITIDRMKLSLDDVLRIDALDDVFQIHWE
ncbi:MAG: hypothetical protein II672_03955, partial [Oscillospiraceae bacterium]|nr:hypothetical protein [Oscillospiraceae bacterium]